ncbi:hypothetical protein [Salisaeta longa]|uniref:hypothetical protein n=1 Tax=Salisaeta longa TaxID=503170 RepID=UPI0003B4AE52|nr:hypothetical protein [Salisaeta longa]
MRKLTKALLLTAAATGAAALVLRQIDWDPPRASGGPAALDPDEMPEEDVNMLLRELAAQL